MIKAVIFDFFGVLATRGLRQFKLDYLAGNQEKIDQSKKLQQELDVGVIGYDDFIAALAKIAGVSTDVVLKYTEDYKPNLDLLYYIRDELKPHYRIGIISNAGADWVMEILGPTHRRLFDSIVLSYKVGVIKPTPEIYKMSAENLEVKESECVFVDDILAYAQGAEQAGMKAIWYRNFDQMKTELEKLITVSDN